MLTGKWCVCLSLSRADGFGKVQGQQVAVTTSSTTTSLTSTTTSNTPSNPMIAATVPSTGGGKIMSLVANGGTVFSVRCRGREGDPPPSHRVHMNMLPMQVV